MRSNQHEIGVTQAMRDLFLGEYRQHFTVRYIWLGGEQDGFAADGTATYYDTRQNQPLRPPEWRLYYPSNPVTETMSEGDALFLAPDNDGLLYFIVAPAGSTSEQQLSWLFGVQPSRSFVSREVATDEPALNFAARFILDELGVEFQEADEARLDDIVKGFAAFPSTDEFSALARQTLPHAVSSNDDPDKALLAWLEHEEDLFRCLVPIPTKSSTHSGRSRPAVPGQVVHRFRARSSGLSGDPWRGAGHGWIRRGREGCGPPWLSRRAASWSHP